jgi:hypothetical protein
VHEGRGLNAYYPMPFRRRVRVDLENASARAVPLYYQIDYTLERELPEDAGYLHAASRRASARSSRSPAACAGPGVSSAARSECACWTPARYARTHPAAGAGWTHRPAPGVLAWGIAERVDDYCATAFTYCREPQPVPRLDLASALADISRLPFETPHPLEAALAAV